MPGIRPNTRHESEVRPRLDLQKAEMADLPHQLLNAGLLILMQDWAFLHRMDIFCARHHVPSQMSHTQKKARQSNQLISSSLIAHLQCNPHNSIPQCQDISKSVNDDNSVDPSIVGVLFVAFLSRSVQSSWFVPNSKFSLLCQT